MKNLKTSIYSLLLIVSVIFTACNHSRVVVPNDVDSEEIYKALAPNDEETPQGVTFGPDSIAGFIFDYEMTTDNSDIYVFFDNLTVLDVNPAITQDIFEFAHGQLSEYGFISDSTVMAPNEMEQLISKGYNFAEASGELLQSINNEFDNNLKVIQEYKSPFNAHFEIYPLFLDNKIVTYRLSAYCYTGGAHGITISYIRSYDLGTGKKLDFDDFIKVDAREDVREEIAAHMAYSYPIYDNITTLDQYIDSLNIWLDNFDTDNETIITARNFPVTDAALIDLGLVVVYQMYQLTPGSDGCPVVVIPFKDIPGCLNPEWLPASLAAETPLE